MSRDTSTSGIQSIIPMVTYSRHSPIEPNNLDEVKLQWSAHFKVEHGCYGDFIEPMKYYLEDMPPWDEVTAAGLDGFALEIVKKAHLEEVSSVAKSNRKGKELRAKIYAMMWKHTSEEARAQIARVPGYPALNTAGNDPLELWKMMNLALVTTTRGDDEATQVACSVAYGTIRQDTKASLEDYLRLFKNRASRHELCGLAAPSEGQMAVHFINCLDTARFSGYQFYVRNGMLKKPPTLQEAYDSASDFFLTRTRRGGRNAEKGGNDQFAYGAEDQVRGEGKHGSKDTRKKNAASERERKPARSGADVKGRSNPGRGNPRDRDMSKILCYSCDQMGHLARNCPNTKSETAAAAVEEGDDSGEDESSFMCTGMELAMTANDKHRLVSMGPSEVGVDSMCTASIFGNSDLLTDVHEVEAITFRGVGGLIEVHQRGTHPHFGDVYVRTGLPNLLSLGGLARRPDVHIEFMQHQGSFNISFGEFMYCFSMRRGRTIFTCDIDQDMTMTAAGAQEITESGELAMGLSGVETVEENERLYSKAQVDRAKRVKRFSAAMGFPSKSNLLEIIKGGRTEGIDFDHEDVARAHEIYGDDLQAVRGKSFRYKRGSNYSSGRPVGKVVEVKQSMNVDIMFACGYAFLVSYTTPLFLLMCDHIKTKNVSDVKRALMHQIGVFKSRGFEVVEVKADGEGAIGALQGELEHLGCTVNIHAPGTYSAEVDVKIKQIKNAVRSALVLPYPLPLMLLIYCVLFCVGRINMLPTKTAAHGFSPFELFTGRSISYSRDLGARRGGKPLAFGSRCEVYTSTSNNMADRTRPALWLGPCGNSYGSGLFFTLDTLTIVKRDQWKGLPMDQGTINRLTVISNNRGRVPKKLQDLNYIDDEEERTFESDTVIHTRSVTDGDLTDFTLHTTEDEAEERVDLVRAADVELRRESRQIPSMYDDDADGIDDVAIDHDIDSDIAPLGDAGDEGVTQAYHDPAGQGGSRGDTAVEQPWFLHGSPLQGEARGTRVRRQPDRLTYAAFWTGQNSHELHEPFLIEHASDNHIRWGAAVEPMVPVRVRAKSGSRSHLAAADAYRVKHEEVYHISVDKAIKSFGKKAVNSIVKELTSIHTKGVFKQVRYRDLTMADKRKIIRGSMFLKEKYLSTGAFEKLKARFVAGGDRQDRSLYDASETSAPTVSLQAVYIVITIAGCEGRIVYTMDVGTAYLNADMKKRVLLRVGKGLAGYLVDIAPTEYILEGDQSIIVELQKALYGCVESACLWNEMLTASLIAMGFTANVRDPCVFNMIRNNCQVTVCVYVDDILCTSKARSNCEWVYQQLVEEYKEVSITRGTTHSYLGQTMDFTTAGEVRVSMDGYIEDMLKAYEITGERSTPGGVDLYEVDTELPLLDGIELQQLRSRTMKLLYLVQRVCPEALTQVSFLTTRVTKGTSQDIKKLLHVLKYINANKLQYITLKMALTEGGIANIFAFVDASFAVHVDMKSHTGMVLSLGYGCIYTMSKKQTLVTKSSTEAELVAVSDAIPQIVWTRDFMVSQGLTVAPTVLYQDNMSTIALILKGRSTSGRTRHINVKHFWIKDRVDEGTVRLEHMPTLGMWADIMTKPLQGALFRSMRACIRGGSSALSVKGELVESSFSGGLPRVNTQCEDSLCDGAARVSDHEEKGI